MNRIGVVGAGTMGIGVAHAVAVKGLSVVLVDTSPAALDRARRLIAENARFYAILDRRLAAATPDEVLARITFTTDLKKLSDVDFVVENITENWELKSHVYRELDQICQAGCLFGVNTSAIPITKVAALTSRPDLVVGTHFMNPVPLKPLVEVIRGYHTSATTIDSTRRFLRAIGLDCVVVEDSSGFVTNRIAMLTVNEAILLLQEGVSVPADIDRLFQQCFGHPMGPLATADLIGLDTILYSLEVLLENLGDSKFRPAPLLRKLVAAGLLGRKSGQGFFSYESEVVR